MKFELWKYLCPETGRFNYLVRDTSIGAYKDGAVLMADQSSYPEDNNKMVWKKASYPEVVWRKCKDDTEAEVIATAVHPDYLVARG